MSVASRGKKKTSVQVMGAKAVPCYALERAARPGSLFFESGDYKGGLPEMGAPARKPLCRSSRRRKKRTDLMGEDLDAKSLRLRLAFRRPVRDTGREDCVKQPDSGN